MDTKTKQQRGSVPPPPSAGGSNPAGKPNRWASGPPKQKRPPQRGPVTSPASLSGSNLSVRSGAKNSTMAQATKQIVSDVKMVRTTALYLKGRDVVYPDAASLARFNAWINTNKDDIDPAEQKFCGDCGDVDFTLCAHCIKPAVQAAPPVAVEIIPANLRHHTWNFHPIQTLKEGFRWPGFDTHSLSDDRLHGFSNADLPNDLVIPELFGFLVNNMQTSYIVNGADDRALRLSHVHRLAQKWAIKKEREEQIETDAHYSVRFRLTIQRACDNAQNRMLYEERDPRRNFGLAWLPKSPLGLVALFLVVVIACANISTTIGLVVRALEVAQICGWIIISAFKCLAATVPDLVPRLILSVSAHQSGKAQSFQCVSTDYDNRWFVPEGDAHAVIQSCNFTDWVAAGLTEAFYQASETYQRTSDAMNGYRDEVCVKAWWEQVGYKTIWSGRKLQEALGQGHLGPWDVIRLWFWTIWSELKLLLFRC